jgi:hypothetical protein
VYISHKANTFGTFLVLLTTCYNHVFTKLNACLHRDGTFFFVCTGVHVVSSKDTSAMRTGLKKKQAVQNSLKYITFLYTGCPITHGIHCK